MKKRMTDDEIMDHSFSRIFGDLDRIQSGELFSSKGEDTQGAAPNAGTPGIEGIDITIKPKMAAAAEGGRPPESGEPMGENEEEEEEDKMKGIGKISPLMSRLHGDR